MKILPKVMQVILLLAILGTLSGISPQANAVEFTVELVAELTERANPAPREVRDGFPWLLTGKGIVGVECLEERKEVCLPANCVLDTSRTYSTSTHLGGGFGQGGPGYGIVVYNVNDPPRQGFASHVMDYTRNCLTSQVRVCRHRAKRGWYRADHILYGRCGTETRWTGSVVKPVSPGVFNLTPADGYQKLAEFDVPLGTPGGIVVTRPVYTVRVTSKNPPTADVQVGMFAGNPLQTSEMGREFWAIVDAENDLTVTAVEVSQGMQNLANEMPLVAERRTFVRGYVRSTINVGSVDARLRGFRNGTELPQSPLAPEQPINVAEDGGDRLRLDHGFLFRLPPQWRREGDLGLRFEIDSAGTVPETDEANNVHIQTVRFHPPRDLEFTTVPFHLHPEGDHSRPVLTYNHTDGTFWPITSDALRHLPISHLLFRDCGIAPQKPTFHGWPLHQEWDLTKGINQVFILSRVMWIRALSSCGSPQQHWVGLVHTDIDTNNGGMAPIGRSSWVHMHPWQRPFSPWSLVGGSTFAHEIGHNRGLAHVRCNGEEGFPVNPLYPYPEPNCRLAEGDNGYFGLDVYHDLWNLPQATVISNDPAAPHPHRAFPLMGYEDPGWTSPFSYCSLLLASGIPCNPLAIRSRPVLGESGEPGERGRTDENFGAGVEERAAPALEPRRPTSYLLIGGVVDGDTGHVEELTVRRVKQLPPNLKRVADSELDLRREVGDESPWKVVQVGGFGEELGAQPVVPGVGDGGEGFLAFLEGVGAEPGLERVELRHLGVTVAQRASSSNPPIVRLLEPNGGSLTGRVTVRWEASDPDGDPLTFAVYYSPDDGATWRLVALDIYERVFQVESVRQLPASSRGRFRVEAHDGFHTAFDVSDSPLSVPGSPPSVYILEADGLEVPEGATLQLSGVVSDIEDGPITEDKRFAWNSDLVEGLIGRGRELHTRTLPRGIHRVSLTVSDSHGERGRDERIVFIGVERPAGTWTDWLERDGPSGLGDFETLTDFLREGKACQHPLGIECRTAGSNLDWREAGQAYRCEPRLGGICHNNLQGEGRGCLDYEVRFLCLPSAKP